MKKIVALFVAITMVLSAVCTLAVTTSADDTYTVIAAEMTGLTTEEYFHNQQTGYLYGCDRCFRRGGFRNLFLSAHGYDRICKLCSEVYRDCGRC